jgi:CRP/FNR family cyclic AMP-dependent transcriptional regulator
MHALGSGGAAAACDAATAGMCAGAEDVAPAAWRGIAWMTALAPADVETARRALRLRVVGRSALLCGQGESAAGWFGVLDGLLVVGSLDATGRETTIAGIRSGGWFGEGSVLKRETYRYQVRALRDSRVAVLPAAVFHQLLECSLPFNRFVIAQLNARLSQFIAARAVELARVPEVRVARCLVELCNPILQPGAGMVLRLRQCELADLAGLSRQRVNEALARLQDRGAIRVEYGGVRVLDLQRLSAIDEAPSPDA